MFKAWPKIPRLENEVYHITEKIDGTNGAIIIQPYEDTCLAAESFNGVTYGVWAQSRTRLITPEDDNFGFAKWVKENAERLIQDIGVGYHYGEWWGRGINRGYGLDERRFSLFNPTKYSAICSHVPLLGSYKAYEQDDVLNSLDYYEDMLKLKGSYAAPGYMRPEGLVIYAEKAKTYWKVIIDK